MNFLTRIAASIERTVRYLCRVIVLGISLAGLILLAGDGIRKFFSSPDFTVQQITINGNERVDEQEILARAGIAPGTNIWLVDMSDLGERLEQHPAILRVGVQRIPPQRIHLTIEERAPIAFYLNPADGMLYGLDVNGVLLPPPIENGFSNGVQNELDANIRLVLSCPILSGMKTMPSQPGERISDAQVLNGLRFLQLLADRTPEYFEEITGAEWREDGNFILHPRRRIGVMVLRDLESPDLDKKIGAFWQMLEKKNLRAVYVDARFPEKGFAIRGDNNQESKWERLYRSKGTYLTWTNQTIDDDA